MAISGFFRPPDWDAPLDLEQRLSSVPDNSIVRGWVLQSVVDSARREGVTLAGKPRYGRFRDYSLREHLELLAAAAEQINPGEPPRRTLFELGRRVFPAFATTFTGRLALRALGGKQQPVRAGLDLMSRLYRMTYKGRSYAELLEIGDGFAVIRLRQVWTFPDSYHVGVFLGAAEGVFDVEPAILVRATSLCDAELLLSWTEPAGGVQPRLPEALRRGARQTL
jgi:uncharacterized protein (TIGR02265 family)